ncbi:mitochondrial fission ELM1 family protein [Terasakiella sp. SH-1]|uniref:mitochondrial fission ELM1 family protein n=1 Tax=Terasakiella sp. SH-1 TaxID=2560057 RepID=UPI001074851C|nr:mitochondrial fission ELM1 family protein [Terasakiella sp. SH-1]
MPSDTRIWALCDDRAGNVSQCLGVAEALNLEFIRKDITYNSLAKIPNMLLGASLAGLSPSSRKELVGPWPDLVIGAGRRTAPVARYIKKKSGGKTKLVHIMHPGQAGADAFDLICVPAHDEKSFSSNEMTITGAPHRVTESKLDEAANEWQERLASLASPRIGLIVGGATKNKEFTPEMAEKLGQVVNAQAEQMQASVLVTTSRRTGIAADALLSNISVPALKYKFGDEGDNPYFAILALSDILIVTGDSVSMCSEACSTGKPVYIYAPDGMISSKHKRMVKSLYEGGYAFAFNESLTVRPTKQLSNRQEIVERIRTDLLGEL